MKKLNSLTVGSLLFLGASAYDTVAQAFFFKRSIEGQTSGYFSECSTESSEVQNALDHHERKKRTWKSMCAYEGLFLRSGKITITASKILEGNESEICTIEAKSVITCE